MAWTTPATAVANTILTAAFWNTQVRDQFLETAPGKALAAGDTWYASGINTLGRLLAGATGGVLYQAGGPPPQPWWTGAGTAAQLLVGGAVPSFQGGAAFRMPRVNAAANALEFLASLTLKQAPLYAAANNINTGTTVTDIVTQAITTSGGIVAIICEADVSESKTVTSDYNHQVALYRDTTLLRSYTNVGRSGSSSSPAVIAGRTIIWMEVPAAGTYTYRVKTIYTNLSTSGTPTSNASILIAEFAP